MHWHSAHWKMFEMVKNAGPLDDWCWNAMVSTSLTDNCPWCLLSDWTRRLPVKRPSKRTLLGSWLYHMRPSFRCCRWHSSCFLNWTDGVQLVTKTAAARLTSSQFSHCHLVPLRYGICSLPRSRLCPNLFHGRGLHADDADPTSWVMMNQMYKSVLWTVLNLSLNSFACFQELKTNVSAFGGGGNVTNAWFNC